jgi:dihydroxy-acid dehydratase
VVSDGSIHPGKDPETGELLDLVGAFQVAADPDADRRTRYALYGCPGQGSCGAMYTYNTMQSFIAVLGLEPLHFVAPSSDDPLRVDAFPAEVVDYLVTLTSRGVRPRDIVTPAALRNAFIVTLSLGGSTNVLLHGVELARAAGLDLWRDVLSQAEFNTLARRVPILANLRPFGEYYMVDVDRVGGLQVVVKELLDAGLLDGNCLTCTGETLNEQVARLDPPAPDGRVLYTVASPYKPTGGLRLLHGNLAPEGGAVIKVAGVERGLNDGMFVGRVRVFNGQAALIAALADNADSFQDGSVHRVSQVSTRDRCDSLGACLWSA